MISEEIFNILGVKPLEVFNLIGRSRDTGLYRITDNFTLQYQSVFDGTWIDSKYPTFSNILTGEYYIKKCSPVEKTEEIKVGDIVTVVDQGATYRTYIDWFKGTNNMKLIGYYAYGYLPTIYNCFYKVVAKGKDELTDSTIYAIQDTEDYGEIYLIGEDGIEKIEEE